MIRVRTETLEDNSSIYRVNEEAFGGNAEAKLIERIRRSGTFIPQLSLVAEDGPEIVGHLLLSKAEVVNHELQRSWQVIVLAPLAVKPGFQKKGMGSLLMQEGLQRCRKLGYGSVFLIGHPEYYPKFGFKPARAFGIELTQYEVPDEVFMVCELERDALNGIQGELVYPEVFNGV